MIGGWRLNGGRGRVLEVVGGFQIATDHADIQLRKSWLLFKTVGRSGGVTIRFGTS